MDAKLKEMRSISKNMDPNMIIGKNGLTEQVIKNVKDELQKHGMVKLKILKSGIVGKTKEVVFEEIITKTGAKVVDKIGFTITLTRK